MRIGIYAVLLALLFGQPNNVFAQSLQASDLGDEEAVPLDPAVRHGRLPNGFEYFILSNPDPTEKIDLRLVVKAGWQREDEDQLGLAHLLEHLAFNGTPHYPDAALRQHFEKSGIDANGNTSSLYTGYSLRLPAADPAVLESGFQIMREWAQDLPLDSAGIDTERGVVLGEIRLSRTGDESDLISEVQARLLDHPKYLSRSDWRRKHDHNIRTFQHAKLRRFQDDWYRPDLQALVVVGDIDVAEVERRVTTMFGDLKNPTQPRKARDLARDYDVALTGRSQVHVLTMDVPNTTAWIYYKRKGETTIRTVGDYRQALIRKLYDSMMHARLDVVTHRYDSPFRRTFHSMEQSAFRSSWSEPKIAAISTRLYFDQPQHVSDGMRTMLIELERVRRYGFLKTELERAKGAIRQELSDPSARSQSMQLAGRLIGHFVEGVAAPDHEYERALQERLLKEIDVGTVNTIVRDWLDPMTNRDVVIIGPASDADRLPGEAEVRRWFAEARQIDVDPYREPRPIERLMTDAAISRLPFDTEYKVQHNEELGITQLRMTNGITVILKPLAPAQGSPELVLYGSSLGGIRSYNDEDALDAKHSAAIVGSSGVAAFDKLKLQPFLQSKRVSVWSSIGDDRAHISGEAPAGELETMLQVVHLYLTAPRCDSASFLDWKARQLSAIERNSTSFDARRRQAVDSVRYSGHLNGFESTAQEIDRINQADACRFFEDRYTKRRDFVFVLAGLFDSQSVMPAVVRYFGSLPAVKAANPRIDDSQARPNVRAHRMGKANVTFYHGMDDRADVSLNFSGRYTPSQMSRLKLDVLAQALQIRMRERLREKEGGTYAVGVSAQHGEYAGDTYTFAVGFTTGPKIVDQMIAAAAEEVERLRTEGLDGELFRAAVNRVKNDPRPMKDTRFWGRYLLEKYHAQEDMTGILKRRGLLTDVLTNDVLDEAARQYFTTENMMRFVVLPTMYDPHANRN